jgi:glycosyltransferase involved in cell wall biosynthesis
LKLRERGFESDILYGKSDGTEGELVSVCRDNRIPVFFVPELGREPDPADDAIALKKIVRHLRERPYDIVHTHTSKGGFIGRLAARLAGLRAVVHTPHGHIFHSYYGFFETRFFILLERLGAQFSRRIITLTDREARDHLELGIGSPDLFTTVRSGVDLDHFRKARSKRSNLLLKWNISAGRPVVGFVGRHAPVKGVHYLLEAVPEILRRRKETLFIFVGDGELRERLETRAAELGVAGSVLFPGLLADTSEIYPLFDVLVVPSLNEGMGRVIVEAMAGGTAVIATDVGGIPELVQHGRTGLLIPPKDPSAIARAVEQLLSDEPLRRALVGRAEEFINPDFDLSEMINKIETIYLSILD